MRRTAAAFNGAASFGGAGEGRLSAGPRVRVRRVRAMGRLEEYIVKEVLAKPGFLNSLAFASRC